MREKREEEIKKRREEILLGSFEASGPSSLTHELLRIRLNMCKCYIE
jgi:hypothetical protein